MIRPGVRFALTLGLVCAVVLVTRRDLTQPNVRLFTEMADSPAARSQSAHLLLPGGQALQAPPAGTIPRGYRPLHLDSTEAGRRKAAAIANPVERSLAALDRGKAAFENYCQHCHGPRGAGDGAVARAVPAFSMPINGRATRDLPDGEIFHVLSFGRNSMPPHRSQLTAEARWSLVHYLRELQGAESERLARAGMVAEEPDPRPHGLVALDYGRELYDANCAACHGVEGRTPTQGVPTLNVARVLAVAGDDYYREIITHGRKGTKMPAWDRSLTPTQIQSLVSYIRSWQAPEPDRSKIAVAAGDRGRGEAIYRGNCAGCHGPGGKGGIGISLTSPSFLALASDAFLRDTITRGRGHTAMPSGHAFNAGEVSDLLAYLRSHARPAHTFEDVAARLSSAKASTGARVYRAKCAACHGAKGEGGLGTRLDSDSFLSLADDRFLYRAIMEGRPGTAMPAWHFLPAGDVADLIAHLRTFQKSASHVATTPRSPGRPEFGEVLYRQSCQACHGADGQGGVGTQLANAVFLSSASDEFLFRTIAGGKDGTAMRGFGRGATGGSLAALADSDIDHLVAYLRQLGARPRVEPLRRPLPAVSAQLGREVYESKASCARCHGLSGEGGSGPALGNREFLAAASDGFLAGTIVMGRENSAMIPFTGAGAVELTADDIANVVAYIRGFENRPPAPRRITWASDATIHEGSELFRTHCGSCHGPDGKGPGGPRLKGYAPSLNNREFLAAADDGLLLATIALGRPGTPMRAFARGAGGISELSAEEMRKIVAFIRSWEDEP